MGLRTNSKDLRQHLHLKTVSAGLVAAIFGATGPALIIIGGAAAGGLTYEQTISWLFAVYFFGGLFGIFMSLKFRQPLAGAYSIAGAVLVAGSLTHFSLNDAIGAYLVANVLVMTLGVSGLMDKVMKWIPVPIVMGMIVGVLIHFTIDMIRAITISPMIAGSALLIFLLTSRYLKKIPPVLPALIGVIILMTLTNSFQFQGIPTGLILPQLIMPVFKLEAIISISIPLALLIICSENAQATGVLLSEGYKPPNKEMAMYGSLFGFVASFFGAHAINIAGPMTAICAAAEAGKKESRYAASFMNGLFFASFGLFASFVVPFVIAMPTLIITVIAGLAMINVLLSSLKASFSNNQFQMGAFFALIIGMSGISFLNISAPLWAIIGSLLVSFFVENEHFPRRSKKIKESVQIQGKVKTSQ